MFQWCPAFLGSALGKVSQKALSVDVVVGVEEAEQTVAVGEGVVVLLAVAVSVGASVDCIIESGEGLNSAHINRIPAQYTGAGQNGEHFWVIVPPQTRFH